jgi:hypothetical protein
MKMFTRLFIDYKSISHHLGYPSFSSANTGELFAYNPSNRPFLTLIIMKMGQTKPNLALRYLASSQEVWGQFAINKRYQV